VRYSQLIFAINAENFLSHQDKAKLLTNLLIDGKVVP
jgi:hypothetical protein